MMMTVKMTMTMTMAVTAMVTENNDDGDEGSFPGGSHITGLLLPGAERG